MTHEHFNAGFELKFLAPTGVFEGYASVFNVTDSMNDEIVPGAFKDSLDQFRKSGRLPPLLWQHNAEEPIGAWREMHEDSHGLFAKGDLFINDIPLAKEAYKLLKENVVSGLSIGYRTKESHRDKKTGVRVLTKLDLLEVSLVTFPANEQARVTGVKTFFSAGHPPSEREFEAFLRTAGLSRKQAKGVVAKGHRALLSAPSGGMDEAEALARFRESLVHATEDNKKAALELAFPPEKKAADVREGLRRFSCSLRSATAENLKAAAEDDTGTDWTDDGDADDGGEAPSSGSGLQQAPDSASKQRAMAIYGETSGLTPSLNNPNTSPYNSSNWDPNSTDLLAEARAYIGIVSERNPNVNFAGPPSSGNSIDITAWNNSLAAAVEGYNSNELNPNVTNFFLRQDGVGVQTPPWPGLTMHVSLGPFNNVGGGDVPRGPNTYIDFYGKGQ